MVAADTRALSARLASVLAPVVTHAGLDLEDVDVSSAGRRRVLRVVVDRDGGVDLDGVAALSQTLSTALDDSEVMDGQNYVLEVTSPGTDRPLTAPRHWRRAVGRLIRVELRDGGSRTARLLDAGAQEARLDDATGRLAYADVRRARVEVEFSRPGDGEPNAES